MEVMDGSEETPLNVVRLCGMEVLPGLGHKWKFAPNHWLLT